MGEQEYRVCLTLAGEAAEAVKGECAAEVVEEAVEGHEGEDHLQTKRLEEWEVSPHL